MATRPDEGNVDLLDDAVARGKRRRGKLAGLTDIELRALVALVESATEAERYDRERYGELQAAPCREPHNALDTELRRRGVLPEESKE